MLLLNNIFSAPLIGALCRTLVHSLWVGFLLAIITGIIMLSTKKSNAVVRYNLLTGAFLSFIISMLIVFFFQITTAITSIDKSILSPALSQSTVVTAPLHFYFIPDQSSITSTINGFLNRYANVIVLFWFLIIVFRSIGFIGGIKKIQRLKNTELSSVGDEWNKKLIIFSQRLGIKRSIHFFQSGIAAIPMVAGHFKPVILFPVGLLTSLHPDEIEAILIHELAHIKRKDFLINLLQHFAEIIFFFNPAVLWVSSLIKIERENCCDDIAVANTGDKRNYINALVSFQEYHLGNMPYAPALADTKSHLLQRVKRMLYNNSRTLNTWEKTSLAVCLVLAIVMTILFSNTAAVARDKTINLSSAVPASTASSVNETNNLFVTAQPKNDSIEPINKLLAKQKAEADKKAFEADDKVADIDSKTAERDSETSEKDSKSFDNIITHTTLDMSMTASVQADLDAKSAEQKRLQAQKKENKNNHREIEWRKSIGGTTLFVSKLSYSENNITAPVQQPVNPYYSKETYQAMNYNNYNNYKPISEKNKQREPQAKTGYIFTGIQSNSATPAKGIDIETLTLQFISDLSAAQIISRTDNLSYKMSATSLIVNGVVQPEDIHEKLKEKYIQHDDWKLLYNWKE